MNFSKVHIMQKERDPLNLSSLPLAAPPADNWPEIKRALLRQSRRQRFLRLAGGSLAAAAAVTLAIGLFVQQPLPQPAEVRPAPDSLITLSQQLESSIRSYREEVGGMPTDSLIYQVEIEDLIAQVDEELSVSPDSTQLWSQRVNLLLDLSQLYENQLRRDYDRMASL
ncbi:hypothetical protein ACFL0N_04420 [Pseudomonadota bacterium]